MSVFDFKQEIAKLEDKKWEILLRKGDQAATKEWKDLDRKLNALYVWWSNELGSQVRPYTPRKLR